MSKNSQISPETFLYVPPFATAMVFFTDLLKKPVIDKANHEQGKIADLIFSDGEQFAKVTHLIYRDDSKARKKIIWSCVAELKEIRTGKQEVKILLNKEDKDITPEFEKKDDLRVRDILDKQLFDVNGLKVVRVNDILLGKRDKNFCVIGVCVGAKSLMRRLGLAWLYARIKPAAKDKVIKGDSVEPLDRELHTIHVKAQKEKIADLHPEDIADIFEDLDYEEQALIFETLDEEKAARTLIEADPDIQEVLIRNLKVRQFAELFAHIPLDQVADILEIMPQSKATKVLSYISTEDAEKIKEILAYPEESAGAIMSTEFIALPEGYSAAQAISHIRKLKPKSERTFHLYVVDDKGELGGVLPVKSLLVASPKTKLAKLMKLDVIKISTETPKKEVAKVMGRYDLLALPVVDHENRLKGVISADEILANIMPESWKRERSELEEQ